MLDEHGIEYRYREYKKDPLTKSELKRVLKALGLRAADVLRKNDKAYKEQRLTGRESETRLVALMAEHPTLLQRPIGLKQGKAVLGRPPDKLLEL